MIIPVLPILSTHYGASAFQAGLLMASYSLMQFLFSPFWGKLSDQVGRRPILLFCLFGEIISYLILGFSRSLEMLFFARILTGFFGASISTASAYVSDVTTEQDRSKGMALIGAAFGLGFLFGPAIGGGLTVLAEKFTTDTGVIASISSFGVALLCTMTLLFAFFYLKETKTPEERAQAALKKSQNKISRFDYLSKYFKQPILNHLMSSFSLATLSMAMMEATLVLYMRNKFQWNIKEVSFGFAYIGIIIVFTQGYLVRKLLPKLGERVVLRLGLFLMACGLSLIGFADSLFLMALAMTLLSFGNGFTNPSFMGSISLLVAKDEQGAALGTTQSLSALGRVIGPALGSYVFGHFSQTTPFILSGFLTFTALALIQLIYTKLPMSAKVATSTESKKMLNQIGFYQLDNLIQNRIPFLFLNFAEDISGWYQSIYKLHVETNQVLLKEADLLNELDHRKIPKDFAILLLCPNGQLSTQLSHKLDQLGYTNVYLIDGGYQQLVTDRS